MSEADSELRGTCKGWRPWLALAGVWAPSVRSSSFSFQTLSMAYLTGMLSR